MQYVATSLVEYIGVFFEVIGALVSSLVVLRGEQRCATAVVAAFVCFVAAAVVLALVVLAFERDGYQTAMLERRADKKNEKRTGRQQLLGSGLINATSR